MTATAELLEQLRHQLLDGLEDVLLLDEGHLHVELVDLAGERSARASSSRKQGAIWK